MGIKGGLPSCAKAFRWAEGGLALAWWPMIRPMPFPFDALKHGFAWALALPGMALLAACSRAPDKASDASGYPRTVARAGYAGGAACARCHPLEAQKFAESDHIRAMALPTPQTVKGDFAGATFDHLGVVSRFERSDGTYFVTTEGPQGKPVRYEVAYAFGHYPLQQYLVRFPGGRLQCLPLAYDTRPKAAGGQRWFHLYGNDKIAAGDPLHWTGPMQNWNHMCASCHSTALEKGYDEKTDTFKTTWSDMTISCESCHGPAENHMKWAQGGGGGDPAHGFDRSIVDRQRVWEMDPATGIAKRQAPPPPAALVDSCARCHARADMLDEKVSPTAPLCEARRPVLLDEGLYRGTGEIQDEVYEWGSFTQSKMSHAGVTCADCHDPHTGKRFQDGNALCAKCHLPAKFDTPDHFHHAAGSAGALCVNCHMPQHTYMGVDARRDHGFRVPRPDLTAKWGADIAPNACAGCHQKKEEDAAWAVAQIAKWPNHKVGRANFADALCAGRAGAPEAEGMLAALAANAAEPAVARATALRLLAQGADGQAMERLAASLRAGASDPDPVVRAAAVAGLEGAPPETAVPLAAAGLADASKVVRLAAVRVLAPLEAQLEPAVRAAYDRALAEAVGAEELNADRASAQMNLGSLALLRGQADEADARFAKAIARDPTFAPAWANRADLLRQKGDEAACEKMLREGLEKAYDKAPLHHALGLLLIRAKQLPQAEDQFAQANRLRPEIAQHALLLALVQDAQGKTEAGLVTLRMARLRHPGDRTLLESLAELAEKAGKTGEAADARALLGR